MAEFSASAVQTVNPGETIVFTEAPVPCNKGLVRHRDGTGNFLLAGRTCPCKKSATYLVDFGANIAVPTGETVGPISVALSIDGATMPSTQMIATPAAVEEFFNVSRATNVQIWAGCCESFSIRNTSEIPILVENANVVFAYKG
jgi:hypothetical protein